MAKLRPISAPFTRRWREFRIEYLPFVAFGSAVLAAAYMWQQTALPLQTPSSVDQEVSSKTETSATVVPLLTPVSLNTASITNPPPAFSD